MTVKVTIDSSGTITIPDQIREACGFRSNSELVLETVGEGLLIRSLAGFEIEDYTEERIAEFASDESALETLLPHNKQ
jgi:AbrB family looped-hinge helix DNA binding protein